EREHEIVVAGLAELMPDAAAVEVATGDLGHQHLEVGSLGKNRPDSLGDVGRGEAGRRHLVKQRLEKMMVLPVDQGDAPGPGREFPAKGHAAKTSPEHDDVGKCAALVHG